LVLRGGEEYAPHLPPLPTLIMNSVAELVEVIFFNLPSST
jgi:hypothetical protein